MTSVGAVARVGFDSSGARLNSARYEGTMDTHTLIVRALVAVLFIAMGLMIIVVVVGLATKTLDPQATMLALGGIASGIIAGLVAWMNLRGGGDK